MAEGTKKWVSQETLDHTIKKISDVISSSNSIDFPLTIEQGGTNATTAEKAWEQLGGGEVGKLNLSQNSYTYLDGEGNWTQIRDVNVTQMSSDDNDDYPILLKDDTSDEELTSHVVFNQSATINPKTGNITANTFTGNLVGTANKATEADHAKSADNATKASSADKLTSGKTITVQNGNATPAVSEAFDGTNNVSISLGQLDASTITTGTLPLNVVPQGALERIVVVDNEAARFKLTNSQVQVGDTVKQADTGIMYMVVDESNLNNANGYMEYVAGTAAKADYATNANTAVTANNVAGVVGIEHGGTNATDVTGARNNLSVREKDDWWPYVGGKNMAIDFSADLTHTNITNDVRGALVLKLPSYYTFDRALMVRATISIYAYGQGSADYVVSGYIYKSSEAWVNTNAYCLTKDSLNIAYLNVRFGEKDGHPAISIGEVNSGWAYLGVVIHDIVAPVGYNHALKEGWEISVDSVGLTKTTSTISTIPTFNKSLNTMKENLGISELEKPVSTSADGLAPKLPGNTTTYLNGNGQWTTPPNTNTWIAFAGASASSAGTAGYVPAPGVGNQEKFFKADGTWATPKDTTYNVTSTGGAGLAPALNGTATTYLNGAGQWTTPPNTNTDVNVTQNHSTTAAEYPVLLKNGTGTGNVTSTSIFDGDVTINPSNGVITALGFKGPLTGNVTGNVTGSSGSCTGNAATASKLGTSTVGGASTAPIYLNAGTPTAITSVDIAHGGTGATTKDAAWTALGGGSVGKLNTNGTATQYLNGSGAWTTPPNTTYNTFGKSTSSAAGSDGLVPAPAAGADNRYLRNDGTWQVPPNTNTDVNVKQTNSTAATAYPILLKNGTGTGEVTSTALFASGITITPSTGTVTATTFSGALSGKATSAGTADSATSAGKWTTARKLGGISVDGSGDRHWYATCPTAAATAAKVATIEDSLTFTLVKGAMVFVKFTNNNTVANPTLNVNSTGDKAIYRFGTTAPSTSSATSWQPGSVVCLVYDGSYWQMVGWLNDNTNTDTNVTQNHSTTANEYPILLKNGTGTGNVTSTSIFDGDVTINPSNGIVTALGFKGPLTGNVTGNVSGSSGSCTGNAATATKWANGRTITLTGNVTGTSGSFDGSGNLSFATTIADSAVTTAKLAADCVTLAKLGSDVGTIYVGSTQPTDSNVLLWITP